MWADHLLVRYLGCCLHNKNRGGREGDAGRAWVAYDVTRVVTMRYSVVQTIAHKPSHALAASSGPSISVVP